MELWDSWIPTIDQKILGAMLAGWVLKVICTCWELDSATSEVLRFPHCLFQSPERYRTVGSWWIIFVCIKILPDDVFEDMLAWSPWDLSLGFLPVFLLGFIADDIFVLFPALVSHHLREFARKRLGMALNGKPRRLPDEFPTKKE